MSTTLYDLEGKAVLRWSGVQQWSSQAEDIAVWFAGATTEWLADDTSPDAIDVLDVYWGGENSDDNVLDVVTAHGDLIGSFDRAILPEELELVKAATIERATEIKAAREKERARWVRDYNERAAAAKEGRS